MRTLILASFVLLALFTKAQLCTGSLGTPVININFGASASNPAGPLNTIRPGATTIYKYESSVAQNSPLLMTNFSADGLYSIVNQIPSYSFSNLGWHSGALDHTPNDVNGNLMFVTANNQNEIMYQELLTGLCENTSYEFSSWLLNPLTPSAMCGSTSPSQPNVKFEILHPTTNVVLASVSSGPMTVFSSPTWVQRAIVFPMPVGVTSVRIRLVNMGGGGCGNDIAVDDITFRPCGPLTTASFSNSTAQTTNLAPLNSNVSLFGQITGGLTSPAYQWQSSTNVAGPWTDIAGATTLTTSVSAPALGTTMYYRYLSASGSNITSVNCRYISNTITLSSFLSCPDTLCYWALNGNSLQSNNNFLGTKNSFDLRIKTTNTDRMIITALGNIGINTTAPTSKLHVNVKGQSLSTGIRFEGLPAQNYDSVIVINPTGNLAKRAFGSGVQMNCTNPNILTKVDPTNSNNLVCTQVIDVNNNVGIGTANPRFHFEVGGNGPTRGIIMATGDEAFVGWKDRTQSIDNRWGWYAQDGISHLWDNNINENRLSIQSGSGNFGINNSNPMYQVHIGGSGLVYTGGIENGYFFEDRNSGNPTERWGWYAADGIANLWNNSLSNNSMSIQSSNGFVSINNSNPQARFHVNANGSSLTDGIRFEGLLASTSSRFIMSDASGNLSYRDIPSIGNTTNNCAIVNSVPRITATNTLDCGIITDNGTSVGIAAPSSFAFTSLSTTGVLNPGGFTGTSKLSVNGVMMSLAYFATSDETMKTNIKPLENSLDKIIKLKGKSYNWNTERFKDKGMDNSNQLGFLAQELATVIPESVIKKEDGYYAVNYNSIIPVLTEAIKELNSKVEKLESSLEISKNNNKELKSVIKGMDIVLSDKNIIILNQNVPNPFAESTTITFYIPEKFDKAQLHFTNIEGRLINSIDIKTSGKGSVNVMADDLSSGIYSYTLVVDGKSIETKRMIKQ